MILTGIVIPVLTLVAIFLFGVQKFSKQVNQVAGEGFRKGLAKLTKTPLRGLVLGASFTTLIQSSTATTVILVGLVDAGIISFSHSLGVIFGANIGTTVTTQLVAFKITNIAPYFVLLGFLVTYLGGAYRNWGKPIFYFGLIFFSLSLISLYIEPVKSNPEILGLFASISNIHAAILLGLIFTAIVQSSSVTSGLTVLLVGAGLLNLEQAVGLVLGANIGTTVTALLASLHLGTGAKKVALAHFVFNVGGVLIFLPFIGSFTSFMASLGGSTQQVVANVHISFNFICTAIFMLLLKPFEKLVNRLA